MRDLATFDDPNKPSAGFEYVFATGTAWNTTTDGQLGGRPLRGPAGYIMRDYLPEGLHRAAKCKG